MARAGTAAAMAVAVAALMPLSAAHANDNGAAEGRESITAAAESHLMTWYLHAGHKGIDSPIYGDYGTCDYAGYGFTPTKFWQTNMSSIKGSGDCNRVRLNTIDGKHSQEFALPVTFGATIFNDNVGYVKVFRF